MAGGRPDDTDLTQSDFHWVGDIGVVAAFGGSVLELHRAFARPNLHIHGGFSSNWLVARMLRHFHRCVLHQPLGVLQSELAQ